MRKGLSKNRYEHIHVRFSPAIHGLRRFLESPFLMVLPDNKQISFRDGLSDSTRTFSKSASHKKLPAGYTKVSNSSGCGMGPSENLRSHGWRSRSATGAQPSAYEAKLHATAERPQSVIAGRTDRGCRKERFLEGPPRYLPTSNARKLERFLESPS